MEKYIKKTKNGYSFVEIMLVIMLVSILAAGATFGLITYRKNSEYDLLMNSFVQDVNEAKIKATSSKLDSDGVRSSYGIKYFSDKWVTFEGTVYVEDDPANKEYILPDNFSFVVSCTPTDNGEVAFAPVSGENSNICNIGVFYNSEEKKSFIINKYGLE